MNPAGLFLTLWMALPPAGISEPGLVVPNGVPEGISEDSLVLRRIWKGDHSFNYGRTPSPDGRFVPGVDWTTGDLAMLDLQTDEMVRVTDKGSWEENGDFAESSVFSPDGRRLAYAWHHSAEDSRAYELRIIGTDGEGMRVLIPYTEKLGYVMVYDWSRDGTSLLVSLVDSAGVRLATVSTGDGSVNVVLDIDSRYESVDHASLSPNGRHVAYDWITDLATRDRDIRVKPVDGGPPIDAVAFNGDDRLMGWAPDGASLLFYSNRELSHGIWRLAMSAGRPAGEPERVYSDIWQLSPMGFADGKFFYEVTTQALQVHTATLDIESGRLISSPTPIQDPSEGMTHTGVWSPDGRQIAYLKGEVGDWWRPATLAVQDLETGRTRLVAFPFGNAWRLVWAPDMQTLLVVGTHGDRHGLHRFDLRSGEVETLFESDAGVGGGPGALGAAAFSPDCEMMYWVREKEYPLSFEVVAQRVRTGESRVLVEAEGPSAKVALSPDGKTLVLVEQTLTDPAAEYQSPNSIRITTMNPEGGDLRSLYTTDVPSQAADGFRGFLGTPRVVTWTPDARYILIGGFEGVGVQVLYRLPAAGGTPERITSELSVMQFRVHPGGRRVSFLDGEREGEIWVIEGLPDAR